MRVWLAVAGDVVFVSLGSLKNHCYDSDIGNIKLLNDLERSGGGDDLVRQRRLMGRIVVL